MVHFIWHDPAFLVQQTWLFMTLDSWDNHQYDCKESLAPLFAFLLAIAYSLYMLAYPPKRRKLSICVLAIPIAYTFYHQNALFPSETVSDTFGRFLYIWFANMSYEITILEYSPPITKENDGWKSRLREAYKMLFCRTHQESVPATCQYDDADLKPSERANRGVIANVPTSAPKHKYKCGQFMLYHIWKATYLFLLQAVWGVISRYYISSNHLIYGLKYASFFRRMPDAFTVVEMWSRMETVVQWCIMNMFLYEAYHSFFAVLFVGIGLDQPRDWSLSLFGPLSNAWSVRRYWGKHWHNYIYHSFSGHTKVLTRKWLGMRRGATTTRLVENTIVFGVSGLMHSAVRWAQSGGDYDYWCISIWYVAQMIPIVIEGVVQEAWRRKKKELGIRQTESLRRVERWIGYAWVIGWNMWSIPKYTHVRNEWSDRAMMKRFTRELAEKPVDATGGGGD
ncbi:membrane bound O-acyl transferase family-domain-containing protein [Paraphoma chrysanthemicola]|uniref:Membrane bound O-acyl transferase family-domain-containing protein n=1 Tax=Paraphoma chrysanthemicola TaxID=798071 RepID=A0A8K0R3C3_9PLEO|nr:membrane bound O-acyl transferase family-domain-containing protein [Paraphoma chrysanthemicola]